MSLTSKPLWSEGMFIRPQHLQQQNRYIEGLLERRATALHRAGWGLRALTIDPDLLRVGKIRVTQCEAVLPDGSILSIPYDIEAPAARDITPETRDRVVKIAVPVRRGDALEVALGTQETRLARYATQDLEVRDTTSTQRITAAIQVGVPRVSLLLDGEPEDDLATMAIARIDHVEGASGIVLSQTFLPPTVDCSAVPRFIEIIREVEGLLHSLGDTLAGRVDPSRMVSELSGVVDYLLLTTINRFEPVFAAYGGSRGLHPQILFYTMLQLAGELATFGLKVRRPPTFAPYRHDILEECFTPILAAIRNGLVVVMDERVVSLPLQARDYGIWLAPIADKSLLRAARFVLAARSSVPPEALRGRFPMQAKAGPVEVIRDLVNLQIPGIALRPLPVAPREVPYYGGTTYFDLDQTSELWGRLNNSSAFALHVSTEFADLSLELWAIREART